MPSPAPPLPCTGAAGLVAHLVKVMEQVVKVTALSVSIGAIVSPSMILKGTSDGVVPRPMGSCFTVVSWATSVCEGGGQCAVSFVQR